MLNRLAVAFLAASLIYFPTPAAPKLQPAFRSESLGISPGTGDLPKSTNQSRTPRVFGPRRYPWSLQSGSRLNELSPEEKKELERKALTLLDDLVNEAMGLRLIENRIQVLCFAAEMLWKRDENRGRGYFREAVNQFLGMSSPSINKISRSNQASQSRQAIRTQLIQTIADHD